MSFDADLFNAAPYYDDFDPSNRFLRILFRPGFAVQARELTQLQTILQNQIDRFGQHVFEDGSVVLGGQTTSARVDWIRVRSPVANPSGTATPIVDQSGSPIYSDFAGLRVSSVSGVSARVVHVEPPTPSDPYAVVAVEYQAGSEFSPGDAITADHPTIGIIGATVKPSVDAGNAFAPRSTGGTRAVVVTVADGVFFTGGFFVDCPRQSVAVFSTLPSGERAFGSTDALVGLRIEKRIIDDTDPEFGELLLDPASGSPNFAAPGADRYRIDLRLVSLPDGSPSDSVEFIELVRFDSGSEIITARYPDYSLFESTVARRTFDESGNYTVRPFAARAVESADPTSINVGIEPGKAYVQGYEFESNGTQFVRVPRSRQTATVNGFTSVFEFGNTIRVSGFTSQVANLNMATHPILTLWNGTSGQSAGTCRARQISAIPGSTDILMSIYDVRLVAGAAVTDATELRIGANKLCDIDDSSPSRPDANLMILPLPIGDVANTVFGANHRVNRQFTGIAGGGLRTIASGQFLEFIGGTTDANGFLTSNTDKYLLFDDSDGSVVNLSGRLRVLSSGSQLQIDVTSITGTLTLFAVMEANGFNQLDAVPNLFRTKTLVTGYAGSGARFDALAPVSPGVWNFGLSDVYEIESVEDTDDPGVDISDKFVLDNGQRDDRYDHATMSIKPGESPPAGTVRVRVSYFAHAGSGPVCGKVSYVNIPFESVPSYVNSRTGEATPLRNVLDFRPIRAENSDVMTSVFVPESGDNVQLYYNYYLPRTDKIILTPSREFAVVPGIPARDPVPPVVSVPGAMTLYDVGVGAYTFGPQDVRLSYVDNSRFTMRDVGSIDRRVSALEQFANLTSLEEDAKSIPIYDSAGFQSLKVGILVDPFVGHQVGDVESPGYECSIDYDSGELRPPFRADSVPIAPTTNPAIAVSPDGIATLTYTTATAIESPFATATVRPNPTGFVRWVGRLSATPDTDAWFDSSTRPEVRANTDGANDAYANGQGYGTRWNEWLQSWGGVEPPQSQFGVAPAGAIVGSRSKASIRGVSPRDALIRSVGDLEIDQSVVPFARSIVMNIRCDGMKPTTDHRIYFDATDVSQYVTIGGLAWDASSNPIRSDASGRIGHDSVVIVSIPSGQFVSGERTLKVTDAMNGDDTQSTSVAERVVVSAGIIDNRDSQVRSTRRIVTRRTSASDPQIYSSPIDRDSRRNPSQPSMDPLAQTFSVDANRFPSGMFVESVDLWIASADASLPIAVQIRPVKNGFPSLGEIVPFGETYVYPSGVSVTGGIASTDESAPEFNGTRFRFSSPVYLAPGEYAVCVVTNSPDYAIHSAGVGLTDVVTGARVSRQPGTGAVFLPQGSGAWTADQNTRVTFRINRCQFNIPQTPTALEFRDVVPATTTNITSRVNAACILRDDIWHVMSNGSPSLSYEIEFIPSPESSLSGAFVPIVPRSNLSIDPPRVRYLERDGSSAPSVALRANMTTDDQSVSPAIDLRRLALVAIRNSVNLAADTNPASPAYSGELLPLPLATSDPNRPAARYITRPLSFGPGITAGDVYVYVDLHRPEGSTVQVFARYLRPGDNESLSSRPYIQMTTTDTTITQRPNEFVRYTFTTGGQLGGDEISAVQIKIVMLAPQLGSTDVPRVRNLRVIAVAPES